MFDDQAFQQDKLIAELKESDIVKRPTSSTVKTVGIALVNHSRNNNVRIQIRPKRIRPELIDPTPVHQNPTLFVDDARGELNMCLTHAEQFVISCAGAPSYYVFASSIGQMLADLARNNPNIQIHINGRVHYSEEFITGTGTSLSFNPQFFEQYGIVYTDVLGNYRLNVSGDRTARFELRVLAPGNGMTPNQVATLFGQSVTEVNNTVVYHSNSDFYGFTFCMESSSIPSLTRIDYATNETMDELISSGVIESYHNEASALAIETKLPGEESVLTADFRARLLNSFDEIPVRKQDYLLVLESPDVDLTQLDLTKIKAEYDVYSVATMNPVNVADGTLIESGVKIDSSKLYRLNGKVVYPMTMEENDNGHFLQFRIDFDGPDELFIEAEHRLDIKINKASDVTIPLLVDYETDKPQDLSNLTYAVFEQHQFYQFAVNMEANSILHVETPNMSAENAEITIANRVPATPMPAFTERLVSTGGNATAWFIDTPKLVVVQLKVPIGLTGAVKIVQKPVNAELLGLARTDAGKLSIDATNPIVRMMGTQPPKVWSASYNEVSGPQPLIQMFNEISTSQAIAAKGISALTFAQGVDDLRDYTYSDNNFVHLNGKTGAWITFDLSDREIETTTAAGVKIVVPQNDVAAYSCYVVHELLENGIMLHYYTLDDNLVPIAYMGNSMVPWSYDPSKPVSVIATHVTNNTYLGKAYDVEEADLGPLRSDFVLSHNYDVLITDVTEV